MRPGDLAPDHADLGAADLLLCAVDVGNLLAEVEAVVSRSVVRSFVSLRIRARTYLAALVSSTPSILMRLVLGV